MKKYATEEFEKYMEAINTHDFSHVSKVLHKNATFCHAGQMKATFEQIKAYHDNFWDTVKESKFWATDVTLIYSDDKCRVYTYQYNYSGYVEGEHVESGGTSTDVFVKNNEKWELLHEHSGSMTPDHDD
ncbi:MAG: nuclear transport factor 2 family protein [Defluviitaleaceae bacterium]|nr:nuclear transport factor 2 family protein [Defluviitaleaceae bacterium]